MANVYMGTDVEDFIFGEGTVYEAEGEKVNEPEVPTDADDDSVEEVTVTDEEMNAFGVIECFDDPEVACYRIALENEQNYNRIMTAFMEKEFSVLENTGVEMIYEAVNVEQFFKLVKETIARWWSKIQGVIKKVMDEIAKRTDLNKAFVKKFKDSDIKTPEKEKKFTGYNFDGVKVPKFVDVADLVSKAVDVRMISKVDEEAAEELMKGFKEKFETTKSHMRGAVCGDPSKVVSADDFDKELKIALFGAEEKSDVELKAFSALLREMESAKEAKDAVKDAYKKAYDSVKALQKEVKMAENELRKADRKNPGMKVARCLSDSVNSSLGIMSKALSMQTKAMIAKVNQDRAMAAFYVMNQPKAKKEKTNESVVVDTLDVVLV